ncbi:bis-aminopropyl spermidine synthase family protein, partial [Vibrio fortis]
MFKELKDLRFEVSPASLDYKTKFFFKLPAANPLFFQWWYTLESQELMTTRLLDIHSEDSIVCLGTPTLAATIASYSKNVTLLDIDEDIVSLFNSVFLNGPKAEAYDVNNDVADFHKQKYDCIAIDPPWYPSEFKKFISRAIQLSKDGAVIYCSIPQKLTRPGIEEERKELISSLQACGHRLSYVEPNVMKYIVPYFEEEALKNSGVAIKNQPWRSSDLLVIEVNGNKTLSFEPDVTKEVKSFSRVGNSNMFRAFLEKTDIDTCFPISKVEGFSGSISKRDGVEQVNLWTSDKQGFQVDDTELFSDIMQLWSTGHDIKKTAKIINDRDVHGKSQKQIEQIIEKLEELTGFWGM